MVTGERDTILTGAGATIRFVDPAVGVPEAAAAALADLAGSGRVIDLGRTLVVVPGARAGRLLLHATLIEASRRRRALEAPTIATVGTMVERAFLPLEGLDPTASRIERRLAWEATLDEADAAVVGPFVPRGHAADATLWRRIAATVVRLEDELHAAERDFDEAAEAVRAAHGDATRLAALEQLAPLARARLAAAGLATPRGARDALIERGAPAFERVVTVGTLELAGAQRRALARCPNVVAIVAARAEHHHRFDAFGAATAAWHDAALPVADESIVTAETPRDVAECGLRFIAERAAECGGLAVDQVALALADADLAEAIVLAGRDAGIDVHVAAGRPFAATPVGRTLAAIAAYRSSRLPEDFAALLRRPAFGRMVAGAMAGAAGGEAEAEGESSDPIAALDEVRQSRLPASLDQPLGGESGAVVRRCVEAVDAWMSSIDRPEGLLGALASLPWDEGDRGAVERLRLAVEAIDAIPPELRRSRDPLELVLEECAALRLPADPRERSVEAIGWLELPFEPAPHVVVLGMNEGCVPEGGAGDSLVPESVRELLGMATRSRRAARDAALLDALLARAPSTRFVVGRRSAEGEPLVPSRLLLRVRGRELARRVARLADRSLALSGARAWRPSAAGTSRFRVPQPPAGAGDLGSMSVTGFRSYLACGTRFWLDRIERLATVDDDPREIPVPDLGTLVHAALRGFAQERALQAITDPETLRRELVARFDAAARDAFGTRTLPAVRLQLDVMRQRFAPFAAWQVAHAAEGWRIHAAELRLPATFALAPEGTAPMRITGQIDRIDLHESRKTWRIIDYKTGDAGSTPRETHRSGKSGTGPWKDLQLPLYREGMRASLAKTLAGSTIELGYVRLPSNPRRAGWCAADFGGEELDEARRVAEGVVLAIRRGEFPLGDPLGWDDPHEDILQTFVFGGDDRERDADGRISGNGGDA